MKICNLCGQSRLKEVLDLGYMPPANTLVQISETVKNQITKYPLRFGYCMDCFLFQTLDEINFNLLFNENYTYLSGESSSWRTHLNESLKYFENEFSLKKNELVIEVASNDGTFLELLRGRGYLEYFGIEPTSSTAEIALKKGLRTEKIFLNESNSLELCQKYGRAKLVVANNVIAHVSNLMNFAKGLINLVDEKGVISLEFQYFFSLIENLQFDTIYHEHFSYLHLSNIRNIFEKLNYKIVDVKILATHGGSLRVVLTRNENEIRIRNSVLDLLKKEEKKLAEIENLIEFFISGVEKVKSTTLQDFGKMLHSELKVYGYGAAAKTNTFINFVGLNNSQVVGIFDSAETKIGKILPQSGIPILDATLIESFEIDILIIFVWNLYSEIMENLVDRLDNRIKYITFNSTEPRERYVNDSSIQTSN